MSARQVSVDELVAALATDHPPVVLDVRDLIESGGGRIAGAVVLPRRRVEFRIDALVRDRATPLVTVDGGEDIGDGQHDPRAALAADTLATLGYRDVAALAGGLAAWRLAGQPTLSGAPVSSEAFGRRVGDLVRVPTVDIATLVRWQQEGRRVALCDVRSAVEHTDGCVPGAVSMPGFESVLHALDMAGESDVIVVCSSGRTRSLIVARTLIDLGLSDVVALDGGTLAWGLAGRELERGSRRRRVPPSQPGLQFAQLGAARLAKHVRVERIEAAELAELLYAPRGNFHAFDLRDPARHVVAHVPRSVCVASDTLIVRDDELIAVRNAPIVLIDDDAVRALLTGVWLRRLGLPHVRKLAGGFAAWSQSGRPTSSAAAVPPGWREASAVTPGLSADEVARWLDAFAPAQVLHVDTRASYRWGHLPGAAWLPRGWLETRIAALAPSRQAALLLTCTDGAQAAFAAATLRQRGYVHVAWLQGGTRLWTATGHVLESAAEPPEDGLRPPTRGVPAVRATLDWERLPGR